MKILQGIFIYLLVLVAGISTLPILVFMMFFMPRLFTYGMSDFFASARREAEGGKQ